QRLSRLLRGQPTQLVDLVVHIIIALEVTIYGLRGPVINHLCALPDGVVDVAQQPAELHAVASLLQDLPERGAREVLARVDLSLRQRLIVVLGAVLHGDLQFTLIVAAPQYRARSECRTLELLGGAGADARHVAAPIDG